MTKKSSVNSRALATDAFLNDPYNPDFMLNQAVKSSLKAQELKPMSMTNHPNFITAIKAAKRKSRKIFTKKLAIRLLGIFMIVVGFLFLFTSCRFAQAPNEIPADGFYSDGNSNTTVEIVKETRYKKYSSPIVGIIHPYEDINSNVKKLEKDSEIEYENIGKTEITEIDSESPNLGMITKALETNNDREARRLISRMILQDNISQALEIKLLMHLRGINSRLLQSTATDGDSKTVTIEKGDTVWRIAQENKTTPAAIGMLNQIDVNKVKIGQKIKVFKSAFNLVVDRKRNCVYLWQDDHVVKRYDAKISGLNAGTYRLKAQKKGADASIYYSGDIVLAPTGFMTSMPNSVKLDTSDYNELIILLVSDSILQIK